MQFFFFFFINFDRAQLNFKPIEFQNRSTNLYSFQNKGILPNIFKNRGKRLESLWDPLEASLTSV